MTCVSLGWKDEEIIELLSGMMTRGFAELLLDKIKTSDWLDPWELAAKEGHLSRLVSRVPVGELQERLGWLLTTTWKAGVDALKRVLLETDPETATEAVKRAFQEINEKVEAANGVLEFDSEVSAEEGCEYYRRAMREIMDARMREYENRKRKLRGTDSQ